MDTGHFCEDQMKSQDIVILLKLASLQEQDEFDPEYRLSKPNGREDVYSVRGLETSLGIGKSEVSASLNRSKNTGLAVKDHDTGRAKPNRRSLYGFIESGLKYVFPAQPGPITRGIPTGFAAPKLKNSLVSAGEFIHVWPYSKGQVKGQAVEPLFKSVPEAIQKDERLYEYLALVDAIRLGRPREVDLAAEQLKKRLLKK